MTYVGVPPPIKLMGIEHREDPVEGGGREHAVANTHTHTHSVTRDILDGWSLGRGSDTILTHVGVAPPLIKLMTMNIVKTMWGEQARANTSTHTRTVSLVIHRMDGASARFGHKIDTRRRAPTNQINGH